MPLAGSGTTAPAVDGARSWARRRRPHLLRGSAGRCPTGRLPRPPWWIDWWPRPSRDWSRTTGPRYFGFVIGGSSPASTAADMLTSGWDQNGFTGVHLARRPRGRGGGRGAGSRSCSASRRRRPCGFVTGTQEANTDRAGRGPAPRPRRRRLGRRPRRPERRAAGPGAWRTPSGTRPSTGRCGCSGSATRSSSSWTPTTTARSTSTRCAGCWRTGRTGRSSCACSPGNVNTGACDDLRAACDAGARGAAAGRTSTAPSGSGRRPAPRHRHLNDGVELADSWSTDAPQVAERAVRLGVRAGVPPRGARRPPRRTPRRT